MNAQKLKDLANKVKGEIPGLGFAIVVFDFGDTIRDFNYISNAKREDMIEALEVVVDTKTWVTGNRPLNKNKIAKIIKEIKAGNDILDLVPILVKEDKGQMLVLEGQHRLAIAQKLERPVHYIIRKEDMDLYQVAKVNSNVEKWKATDFINCYVAAGNENYKALQKFYKKYGFAMGTCLVLLTNGIQKSDNGGADYLKQKFEQGSFEVKKLKEATQFAEICKSFSAFSGWNGRGFIVAMAKILQAGLCEIDVLLKKFNGDPSRLKPQNGPKEYIAALELIYNVGNSKRRTIV